MVQGLQKMSNLWKKAQNSFVPCTISILFNTPYRTTYASIRIVFQQVLASGRVGFGFALWKCNLYRNVAKRCWLDAKFLLVSEIATVQVTSSGTPFVKG